MSRPLRRGVVGRSLAARSGRARTRGAGAATLVAIGLVLLASAPPRADATIATQQAVEESLTCQCGCGLTVHSCNHLQCNSATPLKREIAEQIASGQTQEQILDYFEHKYGEKILSAPGTSGFNLTAWVVPYLGIGLGGLLIGVVLTRWRRGSAPVSSGEHSAVSHPPTPPGAADNQELRARLERELEEYDRRS